MILQFQGKIPNVLGVEIPPLCTPHLDCKRAKEKKNAELNERRKIRENKICIK